MNNSISLTAIVLTYNEEIHLERCLQSLQDICQDIVVVDSFSSDNTKAISNRYNARFYQNKWTTHATQINWAINNTDIHTDWIIRVDADEYLSNELKVNILEKLPNVSDQISGIRVKRLMYFLDRPLKRAGMYPIWHLKIWRKDTAMCEQRWMDERMKIFSGTISSIEGDLIDHNLNNISWWTSKHNGYATKEAIDILDKIYNFTSANSIKGRFFGNSEERRRWLKEKYLNLPLFVRPFLFFIIRYFLQLGFLEGRRGFIWNVLQCFWYRFLVDAKIEEAFRKVGKDRDGLIKYFKDEFGLDVTKLN